METRRRFFPLTREVFAGMKESEREEENNKKHCWNEDEILLRIKAHTHQRKTFTVSIIWSGKIHARMESVNEKKNNMKNISEIFFSWCACCVELII